MKIDAFPGLSFDAFGAGELSQIVASDTKLKTHVFKTLGRLPKQSKLQCALNVTSMEPEHGLEQGNSIIECDNIKPGQKESEGFEGKSTELRHSDSMGDQKPKFIKSEYGFHRTSF